MAVAVAPVTTAPNPVQAFLWGDNGQQLTPQQAEARQRIAEGLVGQIGSPQNVGEGLSSIAHALMARDMLNQAQDATTSGIAGADAAYKALGSNPSQSDLMAVEANPWLNAGEHSATDTMLASALQQNTPMGQLDLATKKAQLGYLESKVGAGIGYGDGDTAEAERIVAQGNHPGGDPTSLAYSMAFNTLYGPKTVSVPGVDGIPVIQTIQQPIPAGLAKPGYGAPAVAPTGSPAAPSAPGSTPPVAVTAPDGSAVSPSGSTTVATPGGGSVTQIGSQPSRQQFNANKAMTVAAPALASLHQNINALGGPQNIIALSAGDWSKWLATDAGKQALDSINAIANTVASAQSIDPKAVREELTPLPTDSPAMRAYRLHRADEYVQGLASGNDTEGATAAVNAAVATPSTDAPAAPKIAAPDGLVVYDQQGREFQMQGGKPVPVM